MANFNQVIASLNQIVTTDANGNITGLATPANSDVDFSTSPNVALGGVGNLHITGGSNGQFLRTDGSGNLTFANVLATVPQGSQVLVVDPTGNDSTGNGTLTAPFLTVQAAHDYAVTNISSFLWVTIQVNPGTYSTAVNISRNFTLIAGQVDSWITGLVTISNAAAKNVRFSGLRLAGGFNATLGTTQCNYSFYGVTAAGGTWTVTMADSAGLESYFQVFHSVFLPSSFTVNIASGQAYFYASSLSTMTAQGTDVYVTGSSLWEGTYSFATGSNAFISGCSSASPTVVNVDATSSLTADAAFLGPITVNVASGGTLTKTTKASDITAAGSNTQVQFNNNGVIAGSANLTFDGANLQTPAVLTSAITSNTTSGVNVTAARPSSEPANLPSVNISTADGFVVNQKSGNINLRAGNAAGGAATAAGNVNITAGRISTTNSGGNVNITAGVRTNGETGSGGSVLLFGGSGGSAGDGGYVIIEAGDATTGTPGSLILLSGYDANADVYGAEVQLTNGGLNVFANTNFLGNSVVNLGNVANVKILGGTNGQVLQTDGTGNLSWTAQTGGGGNGVPGGSNSQLQFNNAGSFGGITGVTSNGTAITAAVANIKITGGSNNQVLTTDGTGNLSWANGTAGSSPIARISFTPPSNANNLSFTNANLLNFTSNAFAIVTKNGIVLDQTNYTISGSTLTVNVPLVTSDNVSVQPTASGTGSSSVRGAVTVISFGSLSGANYASGAGLVTAISNAVVDQNGVAINTSRMTLPAGLYTVAITATVNLAVATANNSTVTSWFKFSNSATVSTVTALRNGVVASGTKAALAQQTDTYTLSATGTYDTSVSGVDAYITYFNTAVGVPANVQIYDSTVTLTRVS